MNTSVMNHDVHSPAFIRAKSTNDKLQTAKPAGSIDWRRIIELTLLLSLVVAAVYFIAKFVTPQVVTVVGIFVGFVVLRFIVLTLLQITFTILGYLFWIAILAAILICLFLCSSIYLFSFFIFTGGWLFGACHLFCFQALALHFCFFAQSFHLMRSR